MVTWRELVTEAEGRLTAAGVPDAAVSARWIGRQATGADATDWAEVEQSDATERRLASFDAMVARRCDGEPLQYVLGAWGFRRLDLLVDRRVLIPRPETEMVAEAALAELDRVAATEGPAQRPVVADLGTGSGAIGLSVALERPGTPVWLTDASADALAVARANLAGLGTAGGRVTLAHGDWFDALPIDLVGSLAVVVANPPYVADRNDLEAQVADWEPLSALLADDRGLAHLFHLVDGAPGWLLGEGALVLEMAPDQVEAVAARAAERFATVDTIIDLAERPRGIVARRPGLAST
ncbi:MAG: peptide chain release factor N(5)-glutamine methyltransferase [Actinomycetota bacterium]